MRNKCIYYERCNQECPRVGVPCIWKEVYLMRPILIPDEQARQLQKVGILQLTEEDRRLNGIC